ncbi:hypothetical protein F4X90_08555 [Candidatus Poribacteria bacterium]|nr:hypothetical protein [Candidatus Poribacteria bacterium]
MIIESDLVETQRLANLSHRIIRPQRLNEVSLFRRIQLSKVEAFLDFQRQRQPANELLKLSNPLNRGIGLLIRRFKESRCVFKEFRTEDGLIEPKNDAVFYFLNFVGMTRVYLDPEDH